MGWLSGWNNRVKLTVDSSKVDEDLTNFPLLITLSSGSGISTTDTTFVFDELASDANRKKIAVTESDGTSQLYVEIELWDDSNEKAVLWTSVSGLTLSSGIDTDLYLYYDSTQDDNVEERGHLCVHSDDTDGLTTFTDSSLSGHSITAVGDTQHDTAQAKFGASSVYFDGTGDYLSIPDSDDWNFGTGDFTIDFWIRSDGTFGDNGIFGISNGGGAVPKMACYLDSLSSGYLTLHKNGSSSFNVEWAWNPSDDTWYHVAIVRSGNSWYLFVDGVQTGGTQTEAGGFEDVSSDFRIGADGEGWKAFVGWIDEFRIVKGEAIWTADFTPPTAPYSGGYVGDTGERAAQEAWDSDFELVWHMAQDPNGDAADAILDSTSNANHGTPSGSMTSADLVDGQAGDALEFDGSDDYIESKNNIGISGTAARTVDVLFKTSLNARRAPFGWGVATAGNEFKGTINLSGSFYHAFQTYWERYAITHYDGAWHGITQTHSGSSATAGDFFSDGTKQSPAASNNGTVNTTDSPLRVGRSFDSNDNFFQGKIGDVRVSSVVRSDAWSKADYYSCFDEIISFGSIESSSFYFSNPNPLHLSTVYGVRQLLELTVAISGSSASYEYDAKFYNADSGGQIGSTTSGVSGGTSVSTTLTTSSGTDYNWYVWATSSGAASTSDTYTFTNKFLCQGTTAVDGITTSGIPVRLYKRDDGSLIGATTSAGVSGTFSIESDYNEYHYAVAIHPTSSGTNALIYDYLKPGE